MESIGSATSRPVSIPQPVEAPAAPVESAPQSESAAPVGEAESASPPAEWRGESSFETAQSAPPPQLQLIQGGAPAADAAQPVSGTEPASGVQPTGGTGRPAPVGQPIGNRGNRELDGQVMTTDNGGTTWGTGTAPGEVPGANGRDTVMYVNGIQNSAADHQNTLRLIEGQGGTRAVGLYNASTSFLGDTNQTFADRSENTRRANGTFQGQSQNAATRSLSDSIVNHLNNTQDPMHLMAHSQGGVITANALYDARQRLVAQHGEARADEMLGRLQVETFGSAGRNYPNGPQYTHWLNRRDNVTGGMGPTEATGGRGAIFQRFDFDAPGATNHNFEAVYWRQRQLQFQN
jgi:hypothetical protein